MGGTVGLINLTDGAVLSEDDLVTRAGEGDRSAFGALYLRHRDAARRAAGACTSSAADAEDAVAEGFARVFAALPRLAGRPIAFRAYLLTCVRNAATDRLRRERRIDLRESVPEERVVLESASDTALAGVERNLVGEAMQALPRRWRTVLWLTEVEGMTPAQVSTQIGIKPNAVAALAYRARRGLRDAYLQAHLRQETTEGCRATVSRLGVFVRGDLVERERDLVASHLDQCGKCRSRREELTDVNATIRAAFLPVPLLLAGLKGRWLDVLGRTGALGRSPVEVAQLGALGDSPMVHKAVAGLAALLMAVSAHGGARLLGGSDDAIQAAPVTMVDTAGSAFDYAVLPSDHLGGSVLQSSGASPSGLAEESVNGEAGRG
ncbi:MAG: sigma-70 family RNA polymerase sigma factor, partial [Acidimicrobiia bacterium]